MSHSDKMTYSSCGPPGSSPLLHHSKDHLVVPGESLIVLCLAPRRGEDENECKKVCAPSHLPHSLPLVSRAVTHTEACGPIKGLHNATLPEPGVAQNRVLLPLPLVLYLLYPNLCPPQSLLHVHTTQACAPGNIMVPLGSAPRPVTSSGQPVLLVQEVPATFPEAKAWPSSCCSL